MATTDSITPGHLSKQVSNKKMRFHLGLCTADYVTNIDLNFNITIKYHSTMVPKLKNKPTNATLYLKYTK